MNWEIDPLACMQSPVIVASDERYTPGSERFFKERYSLPKEQLLMLQNKSWKTSLSFNERGEIAGADVISNESPALAEAISRFHDAASAFKKYVSNRSFPRWNSSFNFMAISADSAAILKERGTTGEMSSAINLRNFIKPRQTFFARKLGWLNCDQIPPVALLLAGAELLNEKLNKALIERKGMGSVLLSLDDERYSNTDVKLILSKSKSVICGSRIRNTYLFINIPVTEEFVVVATHVNAGGIDLAMTEGKPLDDTQIKVNLAFTRYSGAADVLAEYKKLDRYFEPSAFKN
jgi:hypothetical protein